MSMHTPGPWEVNTCDIGQPPREVFAGNKLICDTAVGGRNLSPEEIQANNHLIAAAPSLLAACRMGLASLEHDMKNNGGRGYIETIKTMRRAIARVAGETE